MVSFFIGIFRLLKKQHLHPELKCKVCFLFLDVFVEIHDRLDQMFYMSKGNKRKAEIN